MSCRTTPQLIHTPYVVISRRVSPTTTINSCSARAWKRRLATRSRTLCTLRAKGLGTKPVLGLRRRTTSPVSTLVPRSAGLWAPGHFSSRTNFSRITSCNQRYLVWMCFTEPLPLRPAIPLAADESVLASP